MLLQGVCGVFAFHLRCMHHVLTSPAVDAASQNIEFPSDAGGNVIVTIDGRQFQSKPGMKNLAADAPTPAVKPRPKRANAGRSGGRRAGADFASGDFVDPEMYDIGAGDEGGDGEDEEAALAKRRLVLDFSADEVSDAIANAAALFGGAGGAMEAEEEQSAPMPAPVLVVGAS